MRTKVGWASPSRRRHLIEAVQQEGSGDDFVGVGWRRPDGKVERPIPGEFLSPATSNASSSGLAQSIKTKLLTPAQELSRRGLGEADSQTVESYRRELAELGSLTARHEASLRAFLDKLADHRRQIIG